MVTDCHIGQGNVNLGIPGWQAIGSPSLQGVQYLGSVHHMGGGPGSGPYVSTEDISFDHELERSGSGRLLLATDERGGGVLPPGASCSPVADIPEGNGGIHAYRIDRLDTALPPKPVLADGTTYDPNGEAYDPYARTPAGQKAVFRAPIRTQAHAVGCTSHVFHQIPGQNRIFMAWYSQGTRVVDFVENADGSVVFSEAGWFIPAHANEMDLRGLQVSAERGRHVHVLGRCRRLQPRLRRAQRRRHLQGDSASTAAAARPGARAR